MSLNKSFIFILIFLFYFINLSSNDSKKYQVNREQEYRFEKEPVFKSEENNVTMSFTTKGYCDVTITVEASNGKIIRHLASGLLGGNAPIPFKRNSKKQVVTWDLKNDQGRYVQDFHLCKIIIALGLKPQFEKTLFHSPHRRLGAWSKPTTFISLPVPIMCSTKEGMYVFEGKAVDHLKMFDRSGNYLKTIYPFSSDDVKKVKGLSYRSYLNDAQRTPKKIGFTQSTLLTSGATGMREPRIKSMYGSGATAMAVNKTQIALTFNSLNRIGLGDHVGEFNLNGPDATYQAKVSGLNRKASIERISPLSLAFSPNGKTLYLSGYLYRDSKFRGGGDFSVKGCLHGVAKIDYSGNKKPEVFLGSMDPKKFGTDNTHFTDATSVACDNLGRVYVSDYMNDRIQIYSEKGDFLKSIKAFKPVKVEVHPITNEIYVYSWVLDHGATLGRLKEKKSLKIPANISIFGDFDHPQLKAKIKLPFKIKFKRDEYPNREIYKNDSRWGGMDKAVTLDPWSAKTRFWIVNQTYGIKFPHTNHIKIYELQNNKLVLIRDFADDVKKRIKKFSLPAYWRQRLYVNPKSGFLYVSEQNKAARSKAFNELIEINPETGKTSLIQLPFEAEDIAFGPMGAIYLRDHSTSIARYEFKTFREIPWDYGKESKKVSAATDQNRRTDDLISAISIYNNTGWHKGGMSVSKNGSLIVSCYVTKGNMPFRMGEDNYFKSQREPPRLYPGMFQFGEILIFDKYGKIISKNAVGGMIDYYGIHLDERNNIYVMASPTVAKKNKLFFNEMTGSLMKFQMNKGKLITNHQISCVPIPLKKHLEPKRDADFIKGIHKYWVEGADWSYGGVGFCGKNAEYAAGGCSCYNSRFVLDYLNRSFVPEVDRCQVAVLDSNGNLIVRIGQYGNIDDGVAIKELASKNKKGRSIGGDETALFYAPYVSVHSNRRLFIADPGNQRIVSVKLNYHNEFIQPLDKIK